ncbi:hypothetical protein RHGRI_027288 [Rhododendron griersonianum]|uniref:Protein kinase domain-containing protein n=1 Tax=Rhododendron griersonianum TaxID=479676 RepID=A0AAV6IXN4_9ERIC|nr:hypothetical protein RHGRI_027288 [Rhododendron griersonianum]
MCEKLKREYQVCEEIGRGRFGVVNRCFSAVSGDSFACKSIDKRLLSDAVDRECVEKEPKILQLLSNHPNILQLCIAHRDIKPDNILFDPRNKLKLADFGSAEWFNGGGAMMSGVVGTPYYVAPEVLSGREYDEKVDVWSAGVVLYVMLSGFVPFYGETAGETFEKVVRGNLRFPMRVFRAVSGEAKDLLRKMICKDVCRRLSAEQVLNALGKCLLPLQVISTLMSPIASLYTLPFGPSWWMLLIVYKIRSGGILAAINGVRHLARFAPVPITTSSPSAICMVYGGSGRVCCIGLSGGGGVCGGSGGGGDTHYVL